MDIDLKSWLESPAVKSLRTWLQGVFSREPELPTLPVYYTPHGGFHAPDCKCQTGDERHEEFRIYIDGVNRASVYTKKTLDQTREHYSKLLAGGNESRVTVVPDRLPDPIHIGVVYRWN